MITDYHKQVFNADICPYCKSETVKDTETSIYGREYKGHGVFRCINYPKCDAYVGRHKDGRPLGRLANKELRSKKKEAHSFFDRIWKEGKVKRKELYKMLSEDLNIPKEFTHIGMFNKKTCIKVIAWSKLKYSELI